MDTKNIDLKKKQETENLDLENQEQANQEETLATQEGTDLKLILDYVKPQLPVEVVEWINQGKSPQEVVALWQIKKLTEENQKLRQEIEKQKLPIGGLTGSKGNTKSNPFVEGFMQALMQR